MSRRLVAALACRNTGSRLYGKPLQRLNDRVCILEQIIEAIRQCPEIDDIVLGISEGIANFAFIDVAHSQRVNYIFGDPQDVLKRLIQCGYFGNATDVFRVTTECPWFAYEMLPDLWRLHVGNRNEITVCDRLPEGLHFEIYTLDALVRAHQRGSDADRSEFCSNYPRTHPEEFKAQVVLPPEEYRRLDLRVTVDYPEDLIVAREIAREFKQQMPRVDLHRIIEFLDAREDLRNLVRPYVDPKPIWDSLPEKLEWPLPR